ncbi:ATP-binding protein [Glaciibacter superstes]|uniref:ATP-binding protein n=1 Tax=Glaciibacter superstes TaxID=501023 RepID=UPI00316AEC60
MADDTRRKPPVHRFGHSSDSPRFPVSMSHLSPATNPRATLARSLENTGNQCDPAFPAGARGVHRDLRRRRWQRHPQRLGCRGGIPEDDLSEVFRTGWRGTSSRTPQPLLGRSAGAGLGLAIVQGIVEAHSGGVTVRNIADGYRFEVRLPRGLTV